MSIATVRIPTADSGKKTLVLAYKPKDYNRRLRRLTGLLTRGTALIAEAKRALRELLEALDAEEANVDALEHLDYQGLVVSLDYKPEHAARRATDSVATFMSELRGALWCLDTVQASIEGVSHVRDDSVRQFAQRIAAVR